MNACKGNSFMMMTFYNSEKSDFLYSNSSICQCFIPPTMMDRILETNFNLALLDPSQWGWSAGGKVVPIATPHEVNKKEFD
jgi:hypothetical protein